MSAVLLDVNALVAWEHSGSPHHKRFHVWASKRGARNFRTCAIAELGFIRVSMQVFGYSLDDASKALGELRAHTGGFIETAPHPELQAWASTANKTTDAYLIQIARAHRAKLATFDTGISDSAAELIS